MAISTRLWCQQVAVMLHMSAMFNIAAEAAPALHSEPIVNGDQKAAFLEAYKAPATALQRHYENLEASIVLTKDDRLDVSSRHGPRRWQVLARRGCYSVTTRDPGGKEMINVVAPARSFVIVRTRGDAPFTVSAWDVDYQKSLGRVRLKLPVLFCPYCVMEQPVFDYVSRSDVKILSRVISDDGGVIITCSRDFELRGKKVNQKAWFKFDASRGWILLEYGFAGANGERLCAAVEYGDGSGAGLPPVRRFSKWREVGGKRAMLFVMDVPNMTFGEVDAEAFESSAFGVSTVGKDAERRPFPTAAAGAALLCVALGLAVVNRRIHHSAARPITDDRTRC